jgi:hypothetical protein
MELNWLGKITTILWLVLRAPVFHNNGQFFVGPRNTFCVRIIFLKSSANNGIIYIRSVEVFFGTAMSSMVVLWRILMKTCLL